MERKHWTLLTLGAANGQALTPVKMQKTLFILQRAFPDEDLENFYDFKPYNYGPFDARIYQDAEDLAEEGLVNIITPRDRNWDTYSCTNDGVIFATRLSNNIPEKVWEYLKEVVEWILPLSFSEVVSAVYATYPDMKVNSIFQD